MRLGMPQNIFLLLILFTVKQDVHLQAFALIKKNEKKKIENRKHSSCDELCSCKLMQVQETQSFNIRVY